MKKRIISIVAVMLLAIAIIYTLQNKFSQSNTVDSQRNLEEADTGSSEANSSDKANELKILSESYLPKMQEEFMVTNSYPIDSGDYSIKVTDAVLSRNIQEYSSQFDSPYFYTDTLAQYVNSEGVYEHGAYYVVITVELTNTGEGTREILIPGNYWIYYMNGDSVEGDVKNSIYEEFARGVIIKGNYNVSVKGHLQLEQGQNCTVVLITSVTEEKLTQYEKEGRSVYFTVGNSYIQYIPNDNNRVKFVKLDFRYEE